MVAMGVVCCAESIQNGVLGASEGQTIDSGRQSTRGLELRTMVNHLPEERRAQNDNDDNQYQGNNHDDTPIYIDDDFYTYEEDSDPLKLLPLESSDVFGFLFASMGITMAAGGGIGGGGIVVPVYILIMGFPPKIAIPLSAVTAMGGATAGIVLNWRRRHPLADRPIIDWDLILVMEPVVLVGTMIGTAFHMILSAKVLVILLVILLSVTANMTLKKAKRMYDAETVYIERLKAEQLDMIMRHQERVNEQHGINSANNNPIRVHPDYILNELPGTIPANNNPIHVLPNNLANEQRGKMNVGRRNEILILNPDFVSLRSDLLEEEKITPRNKIIAICVLFSVLTFLNIMVGGGAFESPWGIDCGGVAFWVVHVVMAACLIVSAWAAQIYLVNRHKIKEIAQFDYVRGDIKWDSRSALLYPLLFCIAGVCAGMFGIGGGMVTVPLMLAMGIHPTVATATSGCMTLFTTVTSTTSFAIFGLILWDYALVCLVIGFFACMFGLQLMREARLASELGNGRNFERYSIIAYCIGGVILVSALLMTIQYVFSIVNYDDFSDNEAVCDGYRRVAS